jgi:hypothetical protein
MLGEESPELSPEFGRKPSLRLRGLNGDAYYTWATRGRHPSQRRPSALLLTLG